MQMNLERGTKQGKKRNNEQKFFSISIGGLVRENFYCLITPIKKLKPDKGRIVMKMEPLLKAKYKGQGEKISDTKIYDRGIRQEISGGSALLDMYDKITSMNRKRNKSKELERFLFDFTGRLDKIRLEMLWELNRRYAEPEGLAEVKKLVSDMGLLHCSPEMSDVVLFFQQSLVGMLKEMVVSED
jgi:hypothetical protein